MSILRKRDWKQGFKSRALKVREKATDFAYDRKNARALDALRASDDYKMLPPVRVLVIGVQSPKRGESLAGIFRSMQSKKHHVECISCGVGTVGRPENLNNLLASRNLDDFDFVITTDDDITLPANFIDDFVAIAELASLDILQPAHRRNSYFNHSLTRREGKSLVKQTNYVEVGPLAMFRAKTFSKVFPFPVTKYGWGIDLLWSKLADENSWKLGVVDATPMRHLSPAGSTYDWDAAYKEMERFRVDNEIPLSIDDLAVLKYEMPVD